MPPGLPLPPEQLALLAKEPQTTPDAYHSFLVAPLEYQFTQVVERIQAFAPDVLVYDLLVYAAPLAARLLGIPDIGYCAGLKLIAPPALTGIYKAISEKLKPDIEKFLKQHALTAEFHHLELLSTCAQLVFVPQEFMQAPELPPRILLAGSLPVSHLRCEPQALPIDMHKLVVTVCFGSVLDPANYPELMKAILSAAEQFNLHVVISSRQPEKFSGNDVTLAAYLPLPQLLCQSAIFIHHGGANTFSEALTLGVPQVLIPLTTDQPIQAELLRESGAGVALYPREVTTETLKAAFSQLLDASHPVQQKIHHVRRMFAKSNGAKTAAQLVESIGGKS